jgi:hypothetical protein
MDNSVSLEEVVELEQHFIDSLNPNLNVDLVASGSGHHGPMGQEIRERLRKQRGWGSPGEPGPQPASLVYLSTCMMLKILLYYMFLTLKPI